MRGMPIKSERGEGKRVNRALRFRKSKYHSFDEEKYVHIGKMWVLKIYTWKWSNYVELVWWGNPGDKMKYQHIMSWNDLYIIGRSGSSIEVPNCLKSPESFHPEIPQVHSQKEKERKEGKVDWNMTHGRRMGHGKRQGELLSSPDTYVQWWYPRPWMEQCWINDG